MRMSVRIEGLDDCIKAFDRMPANALKMTEDSLREAARPVTRSVRSKMPSDFRSLIKARLIRGQKRPNGCAAILLGAFVEKNAPETSKWRKMYWKNYGTLKHRDPSHTFTDPIKKATPRRRNNEGQGHENFFDRAMEGWDTSLINNFFAALKRREDQLLK